MDFASALRQAEKWVTTVPGVENVAEGLHEGRPCITVFASSKEPVRVLPQSLGGWVVVVEGSARRAP